jgi:hypothetical protein
VTSGSYTEHGWRMFLEGEQLRKNVNGEVGNRILETAPCFNSVSLLRFSSQFAMCLYTIQNVKLLNSVSSCKIPCGRCVNYVLLFLLQSPF